MLTELQYEILLPYRTNWKQLNSAGEMHCNINCWTAIVKVGKELNLPFNKAINFKQNQSCPACMSEAIHTVFKQFDEYETNHITTASILNSKLQKGKNGNSKSTNHTTT